MNSITSSIGMYILLFIVLIIEGLGLPFGRFISLSAILLMPTILFTVDIYKKRKIYVPQHITIFSLLFLIFSSLSTITSVHIQTAFEHQLYYFSLFLLFLYTYNHKENVKELLPKFIGLSTIIICFWTLFINLLLPKSWSWLIPRNGYQFITNTHNSHYPIGAFILIPLIFFTIVLSKKKSGKILLIVFLLTIILLFSFLRAGYVAFILILFLLMFQNSVTKRSIFIKFFASLSILLLALSFIFITKFSFSIPLMSEGQRIFLSHIDLLQNKTLLNARFEFWKQAYLALMNKPFFGFGSFNFSFASVKFASSDSVVTGSSHNIFLDIFVENGLFAGFIFIYIIITLIKNGYQNLSQASGLVRSIFYIFIALIVLFQFSHYHKMYFLFTFTLFLAGIFYKEKESLQDKYHLILYSSFIPLITGIAMVLSMILLILNKPKLAITIYPLFDRAHKQSIINNVSEQKVDIALLQLNNYVNLYPENPPSLAFAGDILKTLHRNQEALAFYYKAIKYYPQNMSYMVNIYELKKELGEEKDAKRFVTSYVVNHHVFDNNSYNEMSWFYEWCDQNGIKYK
jgi:O-antigen ligase